MIRIPNEATNVSRSLRGPFRTLAHLSLIRPLAMSAQGGGAYGTRASDTDFRKKWDKEEYAEKAKKKDEEERERMKENEERMKQGV